MGTHLSMVAYTTPKVDEDSVHRAFEAATVEIERIEELDDDMAPRQRGSRVNAAAGKSPGCRRAGDLRRGRGLRSASEISEGTFDITFESLHGLWKFDEDSIRTRRPTLRSKAKLPLLGYHHIHLDPARRTIFLDRDGRAIGLGGIAKGYAVDKAAKSWSAPGSDLLRAGRGGPLRAGPKAGRKAVVRRRARPAREGGRLLRDAGVTDHAFSTAGDYERSYIVGGKRYHHIIDPRTGRPATASRSVTIWAPTALLADELDDAVFILGPEKGLTLVEATDGVGAIIVDANNKVWVSKRLQGQAQVFAARPTHLNEAIPIHDALGRPRSTRACLGAQRDPGTRLACNFAEGATGEFLGPTF